MGRLSIGRPIFAQARTGSGSDLGSFTFGIPNLKFEISDLK